MVVFVVELSLFHLVSDHNTEEKKPRELLGFIELVNVMDDMARRRQGYAVVKRAELLRKIRISNGQQV